MTDPAAPPIKQGFVEASPFVPGIMNIRCKCGGVFKVDLSDVNVKEQILSHCCNEEAPLKELRETVNHYIHYVDSRAGLIGKGWDVDLPIDPGCRPTA